MSKTFLVLLSAIAVLAAAQAPASVVGKDAAACASGRPAVQVHVSGFKRASGTVKVALYGSDPSRYLAKGGKLRKVVVPVRSTAPVDVCIAVPKPGRYAVAVHHDLNSNGSKDGSDGGGYSRNPQLSLTNMRPSFGKTAVEVGASPKQVGVQLQYRRGLSIRPVTS